MPLEPWLRPFSRQMGWEKSFHFTPHMSAVKLLLRVFIVLPKMSINAYLCT